MIWAAVIFALSSIPSLSTGLGLWDTLLRKGAHLTEYAILGALLLRALRRGLPAVAAGITYAATDEFHQHFVRGRHASPLDVAIDTVGITVGVLLYRRLQQPRPGVRPSDGAGADSSWRDPSEGQTPGQGR